VVATAIRIGADGVDVRAVPDVVDVGFARTNRAAGLELHVWTVNDLELARRMESVGVDSITTDRPSDHR
ncbi:MAG: glycerophosphodiester phosphodiesterase family protein, partial [Planctomycetota bacterium]|nr:glycerophosphodiester phosphodiesterase family protein [Planctomycetota bacterium]